MAYDYCGWDHFDFDPVKFREFVHMMGGERFHSCNAFTVKLDDGSVNFYSYYTLICTLRPWGKLEVDYRFDTYSATTSRQFGRFLEENTACDFRSIKEAYEDMQRRYGDSMYDYQINVASVEHEGFDYNPVHFCIAVV